MELAETLPGGQVWLVCPGEEWLVGIAVGTRLWSAHDVISAMEGVAPGAPTSLPVLGEEGQATLRALDRLHGDQAAMTRVAELLDPERRGGFPGLGRR